MTPLEALCDRCEITLEAYVSGVATRDDLARLLGELRSARNARSLPPQWKTLEDEPMSQDPAPVQ